MSDNSQLHLWVSSRVWHFIEAKAKADGRTMHATAVLILEAAEEASRHASEVP